MFFPYPTATSSTPWHRWNWLLAGKSKGKKWENLREICWGKIREAFVAPCLTMFNQHFSLTSIFFLIQLPETGGYQTESTCQKWCIHTPTWDVLDILYALAGVHALGISWICSYVYIYIIHSIYIYIHLLFQHTWWAYQVNSGYIVYIYIYSDYCLARRVTMTMDTSSMIARWGSGWKQNVLETRYILYIPLSYTTKKGHTMDIKWIQHVEPFGTTSPGTVG